MLVLNWERHGEFQSCTYENMSPVADPLVAVWNWFEDLVVMATAAAQSGYASFYLHLTESP